MIISKLELTPVEEQDTYETYCQKNTKEGEQPENFIQTIQGEDATLRLNHPFMRNMTGLLQRLCQIV